MYSSHACCSKAWACPRILSNVVKPAQMHLPLLVLLPFFSCPATPTGQHRSARDVPEECRNCLECSSENGCLRCPEKLFLYLRREGMWHHGSCLHACPAGHYGVRGQGVNRCMRCKTPSCESCFSRDFCTKCQMGFQLFKGKCLKGCPDGTYPHLTDCIEGCHLGSWSSWTPCDNNGLTCGFRWGRQSRSRGSPTCQTQSEDRRCQMKKRCPGEKRPKRRDERKRRRKQQKLKSNATIAEPPGWT